MFLRGCICVVCCNKLFGVIAFVCLFFVIVFFFVFACLRFSVFVFLCCVFVLFVVKTVWCKRCLV